MGNNFRPSRNYNAEVKEVPEVAPYSAEMLLEYHHCHSSTTALIQTSLDALVVALEHLGNLFIVSGKKHNVNISLHKGWSLEGPRGRLCCCNVMFKAVLSGVVSEDASKEEQGFCLRRTKMIFCQQMQMQGCLRDHKWATTVNKLEPCEFTGCWGDYDSHIWATGGRLFLCIPEGTGCVGICV